MIVLINYVTLRAQDVFLIVLPKYDFAGKETRRWLQTEKPMIPRAYDSQRLNLLPFATRTFR